MRSCVGSPTIEFESRDGRSSRAGSGASRCRCRRGPGTSTPTCCRARRAGSSSTPGSGCPTRRSAGAPSSTRAGGRVAAIFVTHFHPDHIGAAADLHELTGRARPRGRARLRAVRARVGQPRLVGAAPRVVPAPRRAAPRHRRARRAELGLPAVHPLPARPRADARGRVARRLGARGRAGPRRRPAVPAEGRRAHRRRPPARPDHADGRALAGEPARSARRLPGRARPHDRARAARRVRRPRRGRSRIRRAARASSRSTTASVSRRPPRRSSRDRPQTGYELSLPLFGDDLKPASRRFAIAESLSHAERLVREGAARRHEDGRTVTYTAA